MKLLFVPGLIQVNLVNKEFRNSHEMIENKFDIKNGRYNVAEEKIPTEVAFIVIILSSYN